MMIIDDFGTKRWYKEGKFHREDGPAVEYADGKKYWYKEGNRHREDGPAIECADGRKEYWKNGITWTNEEFCKIGLFRGSCKRCSKIFISKIGYNNDTR